jgi:hypothetical protein
MGPLPASLLLQLYGLILKIVPPPSLLLSLMGFLSAVEEEVSVAGFPTFFTFTVICSLSSCLIIYQSTLTSAMPKMSNWNVVALSEKLIYWFVSLPFLFN